MDKKVELEGIINKLYGYNLLKLLECAKTILKNQQQKEIELKE